MGQGSTKPPIRTVRPGDEVAKKRKEEDVEEEFKDIVDTLGVAPEENGYPEPKPPDDSVSNTVDEKFLWDDPSFLASYVPSNAISRVVSTKSVRELQEFQVDLVPVGASFYNYFKRHGVYGVYHDSVTLERNRDTEFYGRYPMTKTVTLTRSVSVRDSLLNASKVTSISQQSGATKREALLAERERFEQMKLQERVQEKHVTKGQVRRYHFDGPVRTASLDVYKTVEDRVADEIAEKHRDHRAETYPSLIKDLTSEIQSERLKVKVILAWMSKQNIGRLQFGPQLPLQNTPNGYMMLIQEGQGTFPVFFALLCRAAKLKCAIVSGISKGSHYEVGSEDVDDLKNTWNAVYVDGSWQLVHPLWVCKGVANRQLGGWLKIEEEGKSARSLSISSVGRDVPSFNPYFIFTKPEEFIYRNFPDEERWQLLPKPLSLEEFLGTTYIRPIFFMNGFKLLSGKSCIYESQSGDPCEIEIEFPKNKVNDVVFGYELSIKIDENSNDVDDSTVIDTNSRDDQTDENLVNENQTESNDVAEPSGEESTVFITNPEDDLSDESVINEIQTRLNDFAEPPTPPKDIVAKETASTERHVLVQKFEHSVIFEVRFSQKGTYKLRLYGGYHSEFGAKPPWIMDILLKCNEIIYDPEPLPFDPGPVGWGPGPISESLGLFVPSHADSVISVAHDEDTIIYFALHGKIHVTVELLHSEIKEDRLREFVNKRITMEHNILTLQIRLKHPGNGEFCLRINVVREQLIVNACNYLIHTTEKRVLESFNQRRARRKLREAMQSWSAEALQEALEECDTYSVPAEDPEVRGGIGRFEFLSCKQELAIALLVNRIDVAEHALYRTRKANLEALLGQEIAKVEEHLDRLQKLDEGGWTCEIPEIDRLSLVELGQLRKPKLEIRLVVVCLYMLLGIEEDKLKDWGKVRKFLRNHQSTLIEIARLEKYVMLDSTDEVTVSENILDRIQEILGNLTEDDIRRTDNTAAAYYQWVTTMTEKLKSCHQRKKQLELSYKVPTSHSRNTQRSSKSQITQSSFSLQSRFDDNNSANVEQNRKHPQMQSVTSGRITSKSMQDSKSRMLESIKENDSSKPTNISKTATIASQNNTPRKSKLVTPNSQGTPVPTNATSPNDVLSKSKITTPIKTPSSRAISPQDDSNAPKQNTSASKTSLISVVKPQRKSTHTEEIGMTGTANDKTEVHKAHVTPVRLPKSRNDSTHGTTDKERQPQATSKQANESDGFERDRTKSVGALSKQSLQISGKTFFSERNESARSGKLP